MLTETTAHSNNGIHHLSDMKQKVIKTLESQRRFFASNVTKDYDFRITQLKKLKKSIVKYEKPLLDALKLDLNKSKIEAYGSEVGFVISEIDHTIKHLKKWTRNKKVSTPLFHFKASSYIKATPYGANLIIGPWNYPFQLLAAPLVGAISAGNTAILKPSELAPHTAAVVNELIKETFEEHYVAIFEGGIEMSQALLEQKFDYIFFTGSTQVGKIVYQAAAKHLTPVTLELGGKSPCIVDKDTDLDLAAKRIAWGKFLNAGQTCVAPDYIMVHKDAKTELVEHLKKHIKKFFTENPKESPYFGRIINDRHVKRLAGLMTCGNILFGGDINHKERYVSPTLIDNVTDNDAIMQEEIFGPLIPIVEWTQEEEVINYVNEHAKPLALYLFSKNRKLIDKVINETSSGGVSINDTIVHMSTAAMPFGGVGDTGLGAYHGKYSFDTFSHQKAVMERSTIIDPPLRYAPFKLTMGALRFLMKHTF